MKLYLPIFLLSILFFSCEHEIDSISNLKEPTKYIDDNNVEYKVIIVEPNNDINTLIEDNTLLELGKDIDVYQITSDIRIFEKKNVIIQGNGSFFRFTNDDLRIEIFNSDHIIIRDLFIDNFDTRAKDLDNDGNVISDEGRIHVLESNYVTLDNISINKQEIRGFINNEVIHQILLEKSTYSTVKNCKIEESDGELIYLKSSSFCLVENNLLNQGWSGVGTSGTFENNNPIYGHDNKIIGNTITNSTTAYITINDKWALVESNLIYSESTTKDGGPGIRFGHLTGPGQDHKFAGHATCRNNIIRDLITANTGYTAMAITVDYTQTDDANKDYTDLIIENNKITNCTNGINVSNQPGQYVTIRNNEISTTSGPAISLFSKDQDSNENPYQFEPQYGLVYDNILYSNNVTLKIFNASAVISGNYLSTSSTSNNTSCIKIQNVYDDLGNYANDIKILDNVIELEGANGITYDGNTLKNPIISNNTIENGYFGIYFGGKDALIDGNVIRDCQNRSMYIRYGAKNTTISNNHIYNPFECSVYLKETTGTSIFNNKFNYTSGAYYYAVWKNGSNPNCNVSNNYLKNFIHASN